MYVPFEELATQSKVWVYQTNRPLNDAEIADITSVVQQFISNWAAHGQPLRASFQVRNRRFFILAADETAQMPTGCSIDKQVALFQALEERYQLGLLERGQVPFVNDTGEVTLVDFRELSQRIQAGEISPETATFNTQPKDLAQLAQSWQQPAKDTWLKRYFS